jgi:antitoxin VapB
MYIQDVYTERVMGKEYKAKVFKSGNSLALRLPKELGLTEGSIMVLREDPSGYHFEPEAPQKRKLDVDRFWGKAKGMVHVPAQREDFDPRPSSVKAKR